MTEMVWLFGHQPYQKMINITKLLPESFRLLAVEAMKINRHNLTFLVLISTFLDSRKMNVHIRTLVQSATLRYSGFVISWTAFKVELNHFKARQV